MSKATFIKVAEQIRPALVVPLAPLGVSAWLARVACRDNLAPITHNNHDRWKELRPRHDWH